MDIKQNVNTNKMQPPVHKKLKNTKGPKEHASTPLRRGNTIIQVDGGRDLGGRRRGRGGDSRELQSPGELMEICSTKGQGAGGTSRKSRRPGMGEAPRT